VKLKAILSIIMLAILFLLYNVATTDFIPSNDRIYTNGQILTMEEENPLEHAMLVRQGKIVALGSTEQILQLHTQDTEVIDLQSKVILPGFIDSHTHVALSSFFTNMVDLSGFTHQSNEQVWAHLSDHIKSTKPGDLIIGRGIDSILVKDLQLPTIQFLDALSPDNPVILVSQSMHTYWANSSAFKAVGITRDTEDPSTSSYYGRDDEGNLTGIMFEQEAFLPFLSYLKKEVLTSEVMVDSTVQTMKDYASNGNTTVVSAGLMINDKKPLRLYEHLASEHSSPLNNLLAVAGILPEREPNPRHFIYIRFDRLFLLPDDKKEDDFFNILGVKHWYDGSPYTGSMYLSEPYKNSELSQKDLQLSEGHRGKALVSFADLQQFITKHHNKGWQIAIHAQGDQANNEVLDIFQQTGLDFSGSRHRLEHCVLLEKSSMEKLKQMNLFPNFHINHLLYYGDALKEDLLGNERGEQILAIASAKKAGLKYALHADQPMFESKPFRLIQTAVERKTSRDNSIAENEKITVIDALKAMTINAAYSINMEDKIGSLKVGKYADFIIVDKNPLDIPVSEIENIKILQTVINGNEVDY